MHADPVNDNISFRGLGLTGVECGNTHLMHILWILILRAAPKPILIQFINDYRAYVIAKEKGSSYSQVNLQRGSYSTFANKGNQVASAPTFTPLPEANQSFYADAPSFQSGIQPGNVPSIPNPVHNGNNFGLRRGLNQETPSNVTTAPFDISTRSKQLMTITNHFKGNQFSGSDKKSILTVVRDFEICVDQAELEDEILKARYFINAFTGDARD